MRVRVREKAKESQGVNSKARRGQEGGRREMRECR
jgi:hypothetical protein